MTVTATLLQATLHLIVSCNYIDVVLRTLYATVAAIKWQPPCRTEYSVQVAMCLATLGPLSETGFRWRWQC